MKPAPMVARLDQATAMRLFEGTLCFARTGSVDVNALHGDLAGARVLFTLEDDAMRIFGVWDRSNAYR